MKRIASEQNTEYKDLEALKSRKNRDKTGLFLVEGYHLIREALRSGLTVRTIYADEGLTESVLEAGETLRSFLREAEAGGLRVTVLSEALFRKLAETETPQGVLASVEKPSADAGMTRTLCGIPGDGKRILVFDRLQDPGNLGTLIRTADAAGFDRILLVKGTVDPYSPKVLRSTQGSLFRMRFGFTSDADETIRVLKEAEKRILVTSLRDARPLYDVPMQKDFALVIGNEGQGVSETFLREADERITIPMEGETESLNASIAGAVLLFESVRQRLAK